MGQLYKMAKLPIGIFVFSADNSLVYYKLFSKNPEKAIEEFLSNHDLSEHVSGEIREDSSAYILIRKNFREYAKSLGFAENDTELNAFLSRFSTILSKKKLVGMIGRDKLLVQAINAYDDMSKAINLFEERIYEWFSLHYPEVGNSKGIANKIVEYGRRDNFPNFRSSTGVDLSEMDEESLKEFASSIKYLNEEKNKIEKYVKTTVQEIAPNTSTIVDPLLAARLISLAGSLEKMAKMPASTIQLLGAEKALFRHLHKKGKSPKYGILYTSNYIQSARHESKGKVARILSAKLMQASKIDFYSGRFEKRLREEIEKEMKKI